MNLDQGCLQVFETGSIPPEILPWPETKERAMFARKVSMQLKPGNTTRFSLLMEQQVIPKLRKQNGFQDENTFFTPGRDAVFGISFWEKAEHAEAYNRGTYPAVLKILCGLIEGSPRVETFEVINSTFHKISVSAAA
jgi:hypothetical protein